MSTTDSTLGWPRVTDRVRFEHLGRDYVGTVTDRELDANISKAEHVYTIEIDGSEATVRKAECKIHGVL